MKNLLKSAERVRGYDKPTVWSVMTPLAIETQSANLGQGFPSWSSPKFYLEALTKNIAKGNHQYSRAFGTVNLVNSIAKYHAKRFPNLNPMTDILVTGGGVEALFCAIMGHVNPGDEVILLDPSYDCYRAQVQMAGGIARAVPLVPERYQSKQQLKDRKQGPYVSAPADNWAVDWKRLKETLNQKTKMIIINSPHNPSGKVFSIEEFKEIAKLLKDYPQVVVVEDNVYEGLTFDNYYQKDLPKMCFLEGMYDRTLSIYSAGKILAATGARIGWVLGPSNLIKPLNTIHQYNVFCLYDPIQQSVADSLDIINTNTYIKQYADILVHNRKVLMDVLLESKYPFKIWAPEGGYFIMTDISDVQIEEKYFVDQATKERRTRDMAFCIKMAKEDRVVAIPCSSFYDANDIKLGENMVRFAFCKEEQLILEAGRRIKTK